MRGLIASATLVAMTLPAVAQNEIDVQAMTTKHQFVVFSPSVGATMRLGVLADLSGDKFVTNNALQLKSKPGDKVPICVATSAVATRETTVSAYQELAISVEASLSFFGSGKFKLDKQVAESSRENTLYARLAVIDGVQELEQVAWPADWKFPKPTANPNDRIKDFVRTYGTHYVNKLYFGRVISMKAILRESEKSRRDALEAKLQAKFLSFSLDTEFAKSAKNETKDYQFDLFIAISGGKSNQPERSLIRNFDELYDFVKDLKEGQFKLDSTPIAADFLSLSGLTKDEQLDRAMRGDVKFTDPRELDKLRREFMELLGRSFGESQAVAKAPGDPEGKRTGTAPVDGFLVVRSGGTGTAKVIKIMVDGNTALVADTPYSSLVMPVRRGQKYEAYAYTDGRGNPSKPEFMKVKQGDWIVTWIPIGWSADAKK